MNKETQIKHINAFTEKMKAVTTSKRDDYSQAYIDVLSNFKQAASVCGITPEQVVMVFISIKVARLGVLLNSGREPNNESISDSILDLANYSALLEMVMADGEAKEVKKAMPDSYCDTYCAFNESCDRIDCVGSCK